MTTKNRRMMTQPVFAVSVLCVSLCLHFSPLLFAQPSEMDREAIAEAMQRATATLRGRIFWPGNSVEHATIQVYRDSALQQLYTEAVLLGKKGEFEVKVEPGRYYLVAFADTNKSGHFDAGDGMGIYGITEWGDRTQRREAVRVEEDQVLEDLKIQVSAVMTQIDGSQQIIAVDDPILSQMQDDFTLNLQKLFTGIRGQIEWPERELEKCLIFAYTDLSWKYRTGSAIVNSDGSFELKLPPGKYYLLSVIDSNDSGVFDAGDSFGIYGISELGRGELPSPILIEPNQFTEGIVIPIVGVRPETDTGQPEGSTMAHIQGRIEWPGHSIENAEVQIYRDATLTDPVAQISTDADGKFKVALPVGEYYLIANVDSDGDGTYSPGDAIGGYGTSDIAGFPPKALAVHDTETKAISIQISARYDSSGQLYSTHTLEGDLPVAPTDFTGSGISGRILWEGQSLQNIILLVSKSPDFAASQILMMQLGEDNYYAWPINPGDYYIMAVVDANGNRLADAEDGVGVYGTRNPVSGSPQQVSVFADHITPYLDIEIHAIYTDMQGAITKIEDAHRSEIRQQYGEPEDLYQFTRFGKIIQEWWYWTQGVGFVFESVGLGWKLNDTQRFDPEASDEGNSATVNPDSSGGNIVNGTVYYSFDQMVWGLAPNGYQEPLAMGTHPTTDASKAKMAILDIDGNVRIIDEEKPTGHIVVGRDAGARWPVLSPDGRYLVYVRRMAVGSQLHVLHLSTMQSQPIPTAFYECDTPSWSPDGSLIAYAASGSIDETNEKRGGPRNLYIYDRELQRIEPLSVGPEDDAEPAWSPGDANTLVFSRSEGNHRQLWKVIVDGEGQADFTPLTRYGGSHPVWLPDGSAILYENNGQLWVISADGEKDEPVLAHNQVVMGSTPFVIR